MGRPKSKIMATAAETSSPPDSLPETQLICRVVKAAGNNLFNVEQASGKALLVELPAQFRSVFWIKRGGYVVVNVETFAERDNKIEGEVVNVVREERAWRKQSYWPAEFKKRAAYDESDEDEEESKVGKMPSSDEEEDDT